jgi:hypothetical protein
MKDVATMGFDKFHDMVLEMCETAEILEELSDTRKTAEASVLVDKAEARPTVVEELPVFGKAVITPQAAEQRVGAATTQETSVEEITQRLEALVLPLSASIESAQQRRACRSEEELRL